ncbi:putative major facilitator superfamily transporter protein [Botryosphaeria dothidea]|uniref:Major facilitator superfamily transporter protein n=1 Tax=Botryosphaeria dothidea TaxID=55169 RepID=A0A8H4N7R9_9PEZI|nr:putative major facilitator superfamily transporter protein [Botryosphaeria dothidea]
MGAQFVGLTRLQRPADPTAGSEPRPAGRANAGAAPDAAVHNGATEDDALSSGCCISNNRRDAGAQGRRALGQWGGADGGGAWDVTFIVEAACTPGAGVVGDSRRQRPSSPRHSSQAGQSPIVPASKAPSTKHQAALPPARLHLRPPPHSREGGHAPRAGRLPPTCSASPCSASPSWSSSTAPSPSVITDRIGRDHGVGDAVGTLGFADELVALVGCPLWGMVSGPVVGVAKVAVVGYAIVALSLFLFVQASNVYPQLLLAPPWSTAVLPAMTHLDRLPPADLTSPARGTNGHNIAPSISSELTITPARLTPHHHTTPSVQPRKLRRVNLESCRPSGHVYRLWCSARPWVFLPLPARFQKSGIAPSEAVEYSFYVVGTVAFVVAIACMFGLRNLPGEEHKSWRNLFVVKEKDDSSNGPMLPYPRLLLDSLVLGLSDANIGLRWLRSFGAPIFGYLAGRYKKHNQPLILAALAGIADGSAGVFFVVALLGISQIGSIHSASLRDPLLGGTSSAASTPPPPINRNSSGSGYSESSPLLPSHFRRLPPSSLASSRAHSRALLLVSTASPVARGILVLTKLGGLMFDKLDAGAPFFVMAGFNAILLVATVGNAGQKVVRGYRTRIVMP